ncbi:hypothetical protein GALL_379180 [mine drainage metagenome]|uniref:Uncharacterized protein n=1 Tax=mine drainage metagenome TaxID=410659 RepID=A0A1J5QK19_9ZZZZ
MNPAAGVIATRPATAPDAPPSVVALPVIFFSRESQPIMPPTPERCVARAALAARPPAVSAEPALKPIHPNQSRPAPRSVSGRLWGAIISRGHPRRGPSTRARASADAPEQISTTVPPAKSSRPALFSQPSGDHVQWASGAYTRTDQTAMNVTNEPNRIRSADAPLISAAVRIANIIWNATNARGGTVRFIPGTATSAWVSPTRCSPPTSPPPASRSKASEYPTTVQVTETTAIVTKLCMIMPSACFDRTIPA